jgi:UMP-CMP kinase
MQSGCPVMHTRESSTAAAAPVSAHALPAAKPKVLFVLGGPGAGKGTQCSKLVAEYGFVHLSAGDLLRAECSSGSPQGAMITQIINEGKIVPVEVTVQLIKTAMALSGGAKFLIDGFPRNFDNLKGWQHVMGSDAEVEGVLFFDCPEAVMEQRLIKRGETSGRSDDTADIIRKRFRTYVESTMPVIQLYEKEGKVFHVVADTSVDAVFAQTQRILEPLLRREVLQANQRLLDAVHAGDWQAYADLSQGDMTCIEAESNGQMVKGLGFHKFYFDQNAAASAAAVAAGDAAAPAPTQRAQSTITNPCVRLLGGKGALVTYNRLVQRAGGTDEFGETRVWVCDDKGKWRQTHFHRTFAGASAGPVSSVPANKSR